MSGLNTSFSLELINAAVIIIININTAVNPA